MTPGLGRGLPERLQLDPDAPPAGGAAASPAGRRRGRSAAGPPRIAAPKRRRACRCWPANPARSYAAERPGRRPECPLRRRSPSPLEPARSWPGSLWANSAVTGRFETKDQCPQSPRSRPARYWTYCRGIGWSSPEAERKAATCPAVARSPSITCAGQTSCTAKYSLPKLDRRCP